MEKDENIPAHEKRRQQVYADVEDGLVQVLGVQQADYECVMVNSSWPEKSLLEGDIILLAYTYRVQPAGGDIVLIEQDGQTRLGLLAEAGVLQTMHGARPLDASEQIIGVGVALARKLRN